MRNIYLIILASLLFVTCKKNEISSPGAPAPPVSTNDITLITTSAVPGDFVIAQANFTPEKDTATILVEDKTVIVVKLDSNRIGFILPPLPPNSTAKISFDKMGVAKQLSISIGNYIPITQPDVVYNQFIDELSKTQELYASYETDTIIKLDPQFRQVIEYLKQNLATQYAGLTNNQKIEVAYGLRSNMINSSDHNIEIENPSFFAGPLNKPQDPNDVCKQYIEDFLINLIKAGPKLLKGGAMMGGGFVAIAGGEPIIKLGGAVLAGVGLAMFIEGSNILIDAHNYNTIIDLMYALLDPDFLQPNASSISLSKDSEQSITFKGKFNLITQSDAGSSNTLIKEAFNAKAKLTELQEDATKIYAKFKSFLSSNAPSFPTSIHQFSNQPSSTLLPLQGEKLSVTNVSNSAIAVTFVKEDGGLKIKATSTTVKEETPFTMDLVYTNTNTGTTAVDKIDAVLKMPEPASISIISGNNQSAPPTYNLKKPLTVQVKDANGNILQGVKISWKVILGGGKILLDTTSTGSEGLSTNAWQIGPRNTQLVNAIVKKPNGTELVAAFFAVVADATSLIYVAGSGQSAEPNTNVASPLTVLVKDNNGFTMQGVDVTWSVTSGGGQVTASVNPTDQKGESKATWKLGTAGTQTVTATVRNYDGNLISGSPVTFSATIGSSNQQTVTIGTQVWMTKNLDVATYKNGDPIQQVSNPAQWANLTTGAWCYYNNDPANGPIYGKLYNWYAVTDPRGIAPEGFRIPSENDFNTLVNYLGGDAVAAGKLKSTSTLWNSPNEAATNSSGFSALPGGILEEDYFDEMGYEAAFWSSSNLGLILAMYSDDSETELDTTEKTGGYSVRCIKN